MSRLLFVALAGQGHVIPTLPLVAELVRRDHQVQYACGPELGESVAAAGARWVPLPGLPPFSPPPQVGPEVVARWFRHFFAALAATYPVLLEHCREHRPDGVVYDATNWPARLLAHRPGLPAVRTVPNLAENPAYTGVGDALFSGLEHDPIMAAFTEDVAAFAAEHDVELDVAATTDVVESLNLVFVPRAFQPAGDTFDERFLFLGPLLGDREQREAWSPPPGAPVLFVSLGSIFTDRPDFYRTCRDAFADGPFHVAMTIGELDPAELEPLPENVQVRPWFPQLAVLRHASAFLTHAGMNSTMEAISYGVPMLAFPQMPEQVVNADRIVELGIGRRLDPESLTVETLRLAVDDLTASTQVATRLERLRADARAGGGAVAGADAIEQHLRRSCRDPDPGSVPAPDRQTTTGGRIP
jgi:MGT family glycosyltransferase